MKRKHNPDAIDIIITLSMIAIMAGSIAAIIAVIVGG